MAQNIILYMQASLLLAYADEPEAQHGIMSLGIGGISNFIFRDEGTDGIVDQLNGLETRAGGRDSLVFQQSPIWTAFPPSHGLPRPQLPTTTLVGCLFQFRCHFGTTPHTQLLRYTEGT